MKKRADKEKDYQKLSEVLKNHPHIFVTGYEKITVAQDNALRQAVRAAGGGYQVIKNNLASKATEGTPEGAMFDKVTGMTSIAYTKDDPVSLVKALTAYAKTNPALTFKAGIVEGRVIDLSQVTALATMPSKDELYAKLLFLIQAPAQRLVTAMNGVGRNLAVVIDQGVKENKFPG